MSYQYYKDCKISGDIDFIFSGASSVFENCHIHAIGQTPGYLAAPSSQADRLQETAKQHCEIIFSKLNEL